GARAQISMGIALLFACRFSEAIPFLEQAIRLNPYPPGTYYRLLATAHRLAGRYEQAIAEYKKALQTEPNDLFTRLGLAVAYVKFGREQEAKAQGEELLRI
ncbi:MAG: tetratricopeptide repeat protein, partial [candidate division Zixibacteria bacterium]|nr:tetratricopeptide repeat protein [candidate division Zixibacteria bacterium]